MVGVGRGVGVGSVVEVGSGVGVAVAVGVGVERGVGVGWVVGVDAGAGGAVVAVAVGTAGSAVASGVGLGCWEHPGNAKRAKAVKAAVRPNLKARSWFRINNPRLPSVGETAGTLCASLWGASFYVKDVVGSPAVLALTMVPW